MEHTSNYNLSQWAGEDRILREDFNADNAKIEAAILGANEAAAAATASGLKIIYGSFSGDGTTGFRTYDMGVKPKILIARTDNSIGGSVYQTGIIITEIMSLSFDSSGGASMNGPGVTAGLTETGFKIKNSNAPAVGLNASGSTLTYMALC